MPRYSKEELECAASLSDGYASTLRELGLCQTGGNNEILKRWIKEWDVDSSHFLSASDRAAKARASRKTFHYKEIPIEEILVKESTYLNGTNLKKRLYKEGLKTPECEVCGQGEMWRGKRMSVILDHINGIHFDNRIENLRILCPNCNSTLDTHCGRKNKKPGVDRRKGPKPPRINQRKVKRPSYDDLKEELFKSNYRAIGKKYGVSDNAIRKWIRYYERDSN